MHPVHRAQDFPRRLGDIGVRVHRIENDQIGVGLDQRPDGRQHRADRGAEAFPPVQGHQQQPLIGPDRDRAGRVVRHRPQQGVDHGVAAHDDLIVGDTLPQQVVARRRRRRKAQARGDRRQAAIEFLGKRAAQIARAQARLDMAEWDVVIETGHGRGHHRGGVALGQQHVRPGLIQNGAQAGQQTRGQFRQRLADGHGVQVDIGLEAEEGEEGIDHVPMLRRRQHGHFRPGPSRQLLDDRRHLDDFGTSPHHAGYSHSPSGLRSDPGDPKLSTAGNAAPMQEIGGRRNRLWRKVAGGAGCRRGPHGNRVSDRLREQPIR